uniref:Ubiquinone biosynthesis monooxygenase COQ6, mitochondrial n=3 Tax=Anthurium amnicola TaxID=1678845 RepID=A0A1D1ZBL8_9ARAE
MRMQAAVAAVRNLRGGFARNAVVPICPSSHWERTFCSDVGEAKSSSCVKAGHETVDDGEKAGMPPKVDQYDVAIVGGGMVGMAFACALSRTRLTKHLNVAIIDSNPTLGFENSFKKCEIPNPRVSTVTPATISFFKEIGAWDYVQQQRHAYFDKMQVWDYTGLGYTRYNARDAGKECLGCVVENKVLHYSLLSSFQSNTDFQKTFYPARLTSMSFPSQSSAANRKTEVPDFNDPFIDTSQQMPCGKLVKLDLSGGDCLYARLVVGADGSKSHVREMAGLETTKWNYSQNAIICTVEHAVENQCAWQRFLPSGPIALLPIGDRFSNIVWTMTPDESVNHKSMSKDDFVKAINHALDYGYGSHPQSGTLDVYMEKFSHFTGLGGAFSVTEGFQIPPKVTNVVSERMVFPLSLMHAHNYASTRVVLIGDAAHTVHPLAGQGVNLGFGDASALAKVIADGISVGTDIGELPLLKKYEKERKVANVTMMAILDGFQKAFSVDVGPLNLLRAAAFHGAQYIAPLRRSIISYASGEQKWPLFS